MKIVKYMKKNKENVMIFILIFLFSLILFQSWIKGHYSVDTYGVIEKGYDHYAIENSLKDGRILMAGIIKIADIMKLDIMIVVRITLIFSLFITSIATVYLKNIILRYMKTDSKVNQIISCIIAYTIMFNFMYLDNLYFIECGVMSLSLFLHLVASNILVEKKKRILV